MSDKSVFLLQNSKESNESLKNQLEEEDFKVVEMCEDGLLATSKIAEIEPDFLITGLVISGCDGLSVIENVKKLNLKTRIIVISALTREEIIIKCLEAGADYFMAMPYSVNLLIDRMNQIYGESRQNASNAKGYGEEIVRKNNLSIDEKISRIFIINNII